MGSVMHISKQPRQLADSMKRVLVLGGHRLSSRFSASTVMRMSSRNVEDLPPRLARDEECRRDRMHGARRRSSLMCSVHKHSVLGKCIYCMLLLTNPCSHLATAWSSPHGARRHLSNRVQTRLGMGETMEQVPTADVDSAAPLTSLRIRDAYAARETDGILELAKTLSLQDFSPQEVISHSIEAAENNKGRISGMVNAWIGACQEMNEGGSEHALQLLQAYDDLSEEIQVYPDIVTLSLVYSILCQEDAHQHVAQSILERAMKMSKKAGGSKRRRELAAARRRGPGVSCKAVEQELQDLYGSDFRVLQETNDFVVLSKPSGMVCFHKRKTTAGKAKRRRTKGRKESNNVDVSLVDALLHHNVPLSTMNAEGRGLVHRIDRGTSGSIVLAKTNDAHAKLVTQFFLRRAKKSYTAVVSSSDDGAMEPEGEIDLPVDGRPAKSVYSVLERYENGVAKLQVETLTGRKHQVRAHCAKGLNSPILLDPIYARDATDDGRFLLHASSLSIPEFEIDVQAPVPDWWDEAISEYLNN